MFYMFSKHVNLITSSSSSSSSSSSIGTTTPHWVLACSTIIEPSQQEGFYRVLLPAARQTPSLEDQFDNCLLKYKLFENNSKRGLHVC